MRPLFAIALVWLSGCTTPPAPLDVSLGSDASTRPDAPIAPDAGTEPDAPTLADAPAPEPPDAPPFVGDAACSVGTGPSREFIVLYDDIIAANGCTASGCHDGRYAFDMGDAVTAYRNLVGVAGCDGVRVTPCSVEDSYLSAVIRIEDGICAGRRHAAGRLTDEEADRIDDWIRAGAR